MSFTKCKICKINKFKLHTQILNIQIVAVKNQNRELNLFKFRKSTFYGNNYRRYQTLLFAKIFFKFSQPIT